ncbi:MAG: peptidase, partial [Labilithrix sp.]|nr:peptidase [Labilithrix sp.]
MARGDAPFSRTQSAIYKGKDSDSSQNAVVLLVRPGNICTGTLLAPRLVLTARHCVSQTIATTTQGGIACAQVGTLSAATFGRTYAADSIFVFVGKAQDDFVQSGVATASSTGKEILHDRDKSLCNHDIALLVLDQPIEDAPILPVRL